MKENITKTQDPESIKFNCTTTNTDNPNYSSSYSDGRIGNTLNTKLKGELSLNLALATSKPSLSLQSDGEMSSFQKDLRNVLTGLFLFLSTKNKNYGNSALAPVHVFSKVNAAEGILQRMDDKLSRIANSTILRKNDIVDLMGYLAILCIDKNWTDFTDLID